MLFVHQVHKIVGTREAEFEDAQKEWMLALAGGDDGRFAWYLNHAHGSGPSYQAVTVTAVRDGEAWRRIAERVRSGDLQDWARRLDGVQHEARGRILAEVDWSPLGLAFEDIPTDPVEREPTMYMEDTMWPRPGLLERYLDAAGSVYSDMLETEEAQIKITIEAAWRTVPGGGVTPEVTLMQKVGDIPQLVGLLTNDLPEEITRPGTWMHDALEFRDQWRSKLLRTAPWSPLA
jgi:hypothetical protein